MLKDDNRTELEEYKDRSKSQILSFASSTSWWTQAWNSSVDWLILRFFLHSSRSSRSSLIMSFASSWAYSGSRSTFNLASMTEIIISSVSLILDSSRMAGSWTAIKKLSENVSIVEVNVIYLLNAELYILKKKKKRNKNERLSHIQAEPSKTKNVSVCFRIPLASHLEWTTIKRLK